MADDELEELRRRKMQELQGQAASEQERAARAAEVQAQKDMILRTILEPEARERLTRVRMARPEVADSVEAQLIMLAQQGRLPGKVSDDLLKQILARVTPKTRDINIQRR